MYCVVIADQSAVDNLSVLATRSTSPVDLNLSRILPTLGLGPSSAFAASSIEIGGPELSNISNIPTDRESARISLPGLSPRSPMSAIKRDNSLSPSSSGPHSFTLKRAFGLPSGGNSIFIATFFPLLQTSSNISNRCE